MTSRTNPGTELSGWKEIADYLRVSVRTAQSLEKGQGLPVKRGIGVKSPVFALVSDLERWRAERNSPQAQPEADQRKAERVSSPVELTQNVPLSVIKSARTVHSVAGAQGLVPRRNWLRGAVAGAGILGLAGLGLQKLTSSANTIPASYVVDGRTLKVLAADQRQIWRYVFDAEPQEHSLNPALHQRLCWFADVDGDGRLETVFWYGPETAVGSLICFDHLGRIRWRFVPGNHTVRTARGASFEPPYRTSSLALFRVPGSPVPQIALTSNHHYSYPSQLALLDGRTGRLLSEYWHRGHLNHVVAADLDGDGEPEIAVCGVNDAEDYRRATALVFNRHQVTGGSLDPRGRPYFAGIAPGKETFEIFFPRTPLSRNKEFNMARLIRIEGRQLQVEVVEDEALHSSPDYLGYEFSPELREVEVMLSNPFLKDYRAMLANGEVPPEQVEAFTSRLRNGVKIISRAVAVEPAPATH